MESRLSFTPRAEASNELWRCRVKLPCRAPDAAMHTLSCFCTCEEVKRPARWKKRLQAAGDVEVKRRGAVEVATLECLSSEDLLSERDDSRAFCSAALLKLEW
ncbi:hypothetical protein cyc_03183 [Cyclospora cayetanensis]|uniref:Uncharacterized protein n=1 Tax=Cyclospora cayetanensis TaxID=88456 RepID=A0A1D3D9I8_9EIME|nr:hypothetical protein cyc_03183 [Cyclospora cayetanensis]